MKRIFSIALALAGMTLVSGCTTHRDEGYNRSDRRMDDRGAVSFSFGNVAFGYSDGYWDNDRRWHQWNSDRERQSYRNYQGNRYYDWNHDRDGDDGWRDRRDR
ncbi:MAG: hypothetical protein ACXWLX_10705 [Rhizomicrobium sp.]